MIAFILKVLLGLVFIQSSRQFRKAFIQVPNEEALIYLVQDGKYRLIPDPLTASRLMGKHTAMKVDISVLKGLSEGAPIPSFK